MDIKDMIVQVVYESANGLYPLEIAQAVSRRFQTPLTTRQVERMIRKNPKLLVEENGKIKHPTHY